MNENVFLIDWLTVTSKVHSVIHFIELLGLSEVQWTPMDRGMNGYRNHIRFGNISILSGGTEEMGICLHMSGQGCRDFETFGIGDYQAIYDQVDEFSPDMKITRLDVAFDDHSGLLDLDVLLKDVQMGNFVSKWSRKKIEGRVNEEGCHGLECGSRKSTIFCRIYDKAEERGYTDGRHWVRAEIQMRDERAMSFAFDITPIGERFCGVLVNYLRFVEPNDNDSNKSRWALREYWANFIQGAQAVKLYMKPGVEYNLSKCEDYVVRQAGRSALVVLLVRGLDYFLDQLMHGCKSAFSPKYKLLLEQHGISADCGYSEEEIAGFKRQVLQMCEAEANRGEDDDESMEDDSF